MGSPRSKAKHRERTFLTELKNSFQMNGAFFWKITDMPHFLGSKMRFDIKKPFDAFVSYRSIPIAIEAKQMATIGAFGMRHMRPNQIEGLDQFADGGGCSYVFLNVRMKRDNRLYIFPWDLLKRLGTITKKDFEYIPFIVGKKKQFPIESWLKDKDDRWILKTYERA